MYSETIASLLPSKVSAAMKESISQLDWIPCSFSLFLNSLSSSAAQPVMTHGASVGDTHTETVSAVTSAKNEAHP